VIKRNEFYPITRDKIMSDYSNRKTEMQETISSELTSLELAELHKLRDCLNVLQAKQKPLFTDDVTCPICGRILIKPRRGPMPKFCGDKCRQQNHRSLELSRVNK